ncbi:MAG TPA: 2-phosphosulfolactate phosphatase [Chloroflexota bacterium]|jgi:2-phosphosulfolactate phosphatase|nr:2-phosphosulfolactate phosphatase [Chloroflexota bacterium]
MSRRLDYNVGNPGAGAGHRLSVALVRSLVVAEPDDVCVAIDVLRATTTLAVLFARGCAGVWLAADVETARRFGRSTGRLICGEAGGLAPPGFDYGNSPLEFSRVDLSGREIVFATTNGTGTLRACAAGGRVFAGGFVNVTATVRSALRAIDERGEEGGRLLIACAGTHGRFGLEDAACAGSMVRQVQRARPDTGIDDAAEGAGRLFESFPGPFEALRASAHARTLHDLGLGDDVAFCAQLDLTDVVPELSPSSPWPLYLVD